MAIYRDCSEADRPKVFGMTACPTWTPDARQTSLADLEKCLDAKIVTVEEHLDEFALYSSKPIEVDLYGDVTVRSLDLMLPSGYQGIPSTSGILRLPHSHHLEPFRPLSSSREHRNTLATTAQPLSFRFRNFGHICR